MGLHYFHVKITTTKKHVMMKKIVKCQILASNHAQ